MSKIFIIFLIFALASPAPSPVYNSVILLFIVDWRNGGIIPVRVCKRVNRNESKIQIRSVVE